MTEQQLDNQGEAHEALNSVVADFGPRVLSDPRMLESRMSDLIPDLERERGLMVTAARSDVAGELTRHVREQRLDPDTAVQLVSRSLTDRTAIDAASSMWVTSEYAQALGYRVRPAAAAPQWPPGPVPPPGPAQETVTAYGQYGSPYQGTAPQADPAAGAPGGYGGYAPPQAPAGGGGYGGYSQPPPAGGGGYSPPQGPAGGGGYYPPPQAPPAGQVPLSQVPPSQGPPPWEPARPPGKRNRGLIYGLGAAAAAIVIFLVAAFAGGLFKSNPSPAATPTPTLTTPHPPTPTPKPTLAAGVAPLTQLLPGDVDDPATQCKPGVTKNWVNPGLVQAIQCTDPNLPGGTLFAYQVNSFADYQASWANFNTWWGFNTSGAGPNCPPTGSSTQGTTNWWTTNNFFPKRQGQVLECGTVGGNEPSYAWTFPTEDAFIIAQAAPGVKFSTLDSWWSNNVGPINRPSPASP